MITDSPPDASGSLPQSTAIMGTSSKPTPLDWSSFRDKLHKDKVSTDNLEELQDEIPKIQASSSGRFHSPQETEGGVLSPTKHYSDDRKKGGGRGRRYDNYSNMTKGIDGNSAVPSFKKGGINRNNNSPNSMSSSSGLKRKKKERSDNHQPIKQGVHGRQESGEEKNAQQQQGETGKWHTTGNTTGVVSPMKNNAWTGADNQRIFGAHSGSRGNTKGTLASTQDDTVPYGEESNHQKTGVHSGRSRHNHKSHDVSSNITFNASKHHNGTSVDGLKYANTGFLSNNPNLMFSTDTNAHRVGLPSNRYRNAKDDGLGFDRGYINNAVQMRKDGSIYRHFWAPSAINTGNDYPPVYQTAPTGSHKHKQWYGQSSQVGMPAFSHHASQNMNSSHYHSHQHSPYFGYSDSNISDGSITTPPLTPLSNAVHDKNKRQGPQSAPSSPLTMAVMGMPMEINRMILEQQLMILPSWARQRTLAVLQGANYHDPSPTFRALSPAPLGHSNIDDNDRKKPSAVGSDQLPEETNNITNSNISDNTRTKNPRKLKKEDQKGKKNTESLSLVLSNTDKSSLLTNSNNVEDKEHLSPRELSEEQYRETSPKCDLPVSNPINHKHSSSSSHTTRESHYKIYPLCSSMEDEQQRMAKTAFSYGLQQQAMTGQPLRPYAFNHQGLSEELYDFVANVDLTREERELRESSKCRIERCIEQLVEKGLKALHERTKLAAKERRIYQSTKEGDACNTKGYVDTEDNDTITTTFPKPQLVLFGSYALGVSTPCSDLDFTVIVPDGVVTKYGSEYYSPLPPPPPSQSSSTPTASHQRPKEHTFIFPVTELGFLRLIADHLREEPFNMETKVIDMCKVPVVHCFDPKSRVACDINVNMKHMEKVVEIQKAWIGLEEKIDQKEGTGCSTALGKVYTLWPPQPGTFISTAKALIMLTKIALRQWGLSTSFTGGLSSTAVYLLVERFLREKREYLKSFDVMTRFFSHWKTTSVSGDCKGKANSDTNNAPLPPSYAPPKRPSLISRVLIDFWNYLSQDGFVHGYHVHDIFSVQPKGLYHTAHRNNYKNEANKVKQETLPLSTSRVRSPEKKSGDKTSLTQVGSGMVTPIEGSQPATPQGSPRKAADKESTPITSQSRVDEISHLPPGKKIPITTLVKEENKEGNTKNLREIEEYGEADSAVSNVAIPRSSVTPFDIEDAEKLNAISHYWSPTSMVEGFDAIDCDREKQQDQLSLSQSDKDIFGDRQRSSTPLASSGKDNIVVSQATISTENDQQTTKQSETTKNTTSATDHHDDGNAEEEDDDPYLYGPALAFITEKSESRTGNPVPFSETTHSSKATVNNKRAPEHLLPDVARRCNRLGEIQVLFRHSASTLENLVGNPAPHMWALPMTPLSAVLADPRMLKTQQQTMGNDSGGISNSNRDAYSNYHSTRGKQKRHH